MLLDLRSIIMPHEQTTITTRDGECPAHVFSAGAGRNGPAVIFYMDAGGIRPAALRMAERLSEAGYVVLLPDLFYQSRHRPHRPRRTQPPSANLQVSAS